MISAAIGFVISPIGRWVVGIGAAGLLLFLLWNYVTQKAYNNGYSEGSYKVLNAMEEKMQTALEKQREAIEEEKILVGEEKVKAAADRLSAIRTREGIRRDVRNEVRKIKIDAGTEVDAIASIPPSDLVTYIRGQLTEHRELDGRFRGTAADVYSAFFESNTTTIP